MTFLLLLVLASQIKPEGSGDDPGPAPSTIEWILLPWIMSLIFSEIVQLWMGGASDYVKDRWNVMDFFMNSLYLATISTKICAYDSVQDEGVKLNSSSVSQGKFGVMF